MLTIGIGIGMTYGRRGGGPFMALSANSVAEGSAVNTVIGALSVANHLSGPSGWTFAETADPDTKFNISGANLRTSGTWDYEVATSHQVTITASKAAQADIVRVFTIQVSNVFEAASLSALALDDISVPEDSAATINITGATATSTITLLSGSLPAGMSLNSGARTIAGTPTTIEVASFTLRETLADSANSPRDTALSITVTEVAEAPIAPFMSLAVPYGTYPPAYNIDDVADSFRPGDRLYLAIADNARLTTPDLLYIDLDGTEDSVGEEAVFTDGAAGTLADYTTGNHWAYAYIDRDGTLSANSNTVLHGALEDITPAWTFVNEGGADLESESSTGSITPTGFNVPVPISCTAGSEYRINAGAGFGDWTDEPGTFYPTDAFDFHHTNSDEYFTGTTSSLTIGSTTQSWTSTTREAAVVATWGDAEGTYSLSGGDLIATKNAGTFTSIQGSDARAGGRRYFEVTFAVAASPGVGIGVCNDAHNLANYAGGTIDSIAMYSVTGDVSSNGGVVDTGNTPFDATDTVGICIDIDQRKLFIQTPDGWVVGGDPDGAGVGLSCSTVAGDLLPAATLSTSGDTGTLNCGATAFVLGKPTSALSWNE